MGDCVRGRRSAVSDWISLLATLSDADSDEIEPEHPGWRGDYGMLFEDEEGKALVFASG